MTESQRGEHQKLQDQDETGPAEAVQQVPGAEGARRPEAAEEAKKNRLRWASLQEQLGPPQNVVSMAMQAQGCAWPGRQEQLPLAVSNACLVVCRIWWLQEASFHHHTNLNTQQAL